ncbi:unnamed protein product, partial [Didymodactylos carnosus]
MRRTEVYLKPAIIDYCKTVLVAEDIENLSLSNKVYYIFDELCHISQSIVDDLLPFIEHRLTVNIKSLDKITYIRILRYSRDPTDIFHRHLLRLVELSLQMADPSTSNDQKELTELKLVNLICSISARCLPNPDKNEFLLKLFVLHAIKTHRERSSTALSILIPLKQALFENINSKEAIASFEYTINANIIGQQLLDESIKEQKRFPTTGAERKDEIITITDLNGNEQEQTAVYYENINQLLKVFLQHPFIFDRIDTQIVLNNLLKLQILELGNMRKAKKSSSVAPMLLKIIEVYTPSIIAKNNRLFIIWGLPVLYKLKTYNADGSECRVKSMSVKSAYIAKLGFRYYPNTTDTVVLVSNLKIQSYTQYLTESEAMKKGKEQHR